MRISVEPSLNRGVFFAWSRSCWSTFPKLLIASTSAYYLTSDGFLRYVELLTERLSSQAFISALLYARQP